MKIFSNKLVQRKLVCTVLGLLFGLLCVYLANRNSVESIWGTPLMWSILYNRILIGIFVMLVGAFNWHSLFGFRYSPWFRGFSVGMVVSLDLAIGVFVSATVPVDQMKTVFWMTILAGGFYGMVIDIIATRMTGEGKELLEGWAK